MFIDGASFAKTIIFGSPDSRALCERIDEVGPMDVSIAILTSVLQEKRNAFVAAATKYADEVLASGRPLSLECIVFLMQKP